MGTCGQIRVNESRGKVEGQRVESSQRRRIRNEHSLRSMMWADNYWLFCDSKERLVCMVSDIIEELLDLDTVPKQESLWWTTTHRNRGLAWDLPFRGVFEVLGYRFHRGGKGSQCADRTLCKGTARWWRDGYTYRSKSVPMKTKCRRVLSRGFSTALLASHKILQEMMRQPTEKKKQNGRGIPKKKPRDLSPLVLEKPTSDKKLILEIRCDSKTVVDWSMVTPS